MSDTLLVILAIASVLLAVALFIIAGTLVGSRTHYYYRSTVDSVLFLALWLVAAAGLVGTGIAMESRIHDFAIYYLSIGGTIVFACGLGVAALIGDQSDARELSRGREE